MKDKATKNGVKKPIFKKWWFWVQFTELSGRCSVFERPLSDAKRPLFF